MWPRSFRKRLAELCRGYADDAVLPEGERKLYTQFALLLESEAPIPVDGLVILPVIPGFKPKDGDRLYVMRRP
jgi:hypothetical protein